MENGLLSKRDFDKERYCYLLNKQMHLGEEIEGRCWQDLSLHFRKFSCLYYRKAQMSPLTSDHSMRWRESCELRNAKYSLCIKKLSSCWNPFPLTVPELKKWIDQQGRWTDAAGEEERGSSGESHLSSRGELDAWGEFTEAVRRMDPQREGLSEAKARDKMHSETLTACDTP